MKFKKYTFISLLFLMILYKDYTMCINTHEAQRPYEQY